MILQCTDLTNFLKRKDWDLLNSHMQEETEKGVNFLRFCWANFFIYKVFVFLEMVFVGNIEIGDKMEFHRYWYFLEMLKSVMGWNSSGYWKFWICCNNVVTLKF